MSVGPSEHDVGFSGDELSGDGDDSVPQSHLLVLAKNFHPQSLRNTVLIILLRWQSAAPVLLF